MILKSDINICLIANDSTMDYALRCMNDVITYKDNNTNIHFYILGDHISSESEMFLNGFGTADSKIKVSIKNTAEYTKLFEMMINTKSKSIDVEALRLKLVLFSLPDIFPELDRIMYLDNTTYVRGDLREIYSIECMKGDYIISAKDVVRNWVDIKKDFHVNKIDNDKAKVKERDEICTHIKHVKHYRWLGQCVFDLDALRKVEFSKKCSAEWWKYMPTFKDPYVIINKLFGDRNVKTVSNRLIFPYANFCDKSKYSFCRRIRWYNELYVTGITYKKKARAIDQVQPLCDNAVIWYVDDNAFYTKEVLDLIDSRQALVEEYKKSILDGTKQIVNGYLERNDVNIAMSFDENYSYFALRCISEIIRNRDKDTILKFNLLIDNVSTNSLRTLISLNKLDNVMINMINIHNDANSFNERYSEINSATMNVSYWINGISGIKMLLPNILKNVDKVLYIDVDCIVKTDLRKVYNVDLEGKFIAAPIDVPSIVNGTKHPSYSSCKRAFDEHKYFNVNMLIMDLKTLREKCFSDVCLKILNSMNMPFKDKDIFNYLCTDVVKLLDSKYSIDLNRIASGKAEYNDIGQYNMHNRTQFANMNEFVNNGSIIHFGGEKNSLQHNQYAMALLNNAGNDLNEILTLLQ